METWYKTTRNSYTIEEVEAIRSTEKFVVLPSDARWRKRKGEMMDAKDSYYCTYYQTLDEAKAAIRVRCETAIRNAKSTIDRAEAALKELGE